MFSSCAFEFETKPTNNPQNCIQVQKNTGNVKSFNKTITALNFVQYDVLWSTEK